MPEGVGYGPQSTFTGSSNSLITIGKHAYAFGGVVEVTNANEKILSFSTGKEYFVGKLQVSTPSESTDDIEYTLLLNGVIVCKWVFVVNQPYFSNTVPQTLDLVIPPLTNVALHGDNISSSTGRDQTAWVKGKIYK